MSGRYRWTVMVFLVGGLLLDGTWLAAAAPIGYQVVPRDAFPVFDNPPMLAAARAEAEGVVLDHDMVIGVARGRKAQAYPITVMGVHELGNDTIDGLPIAVTW